MESKNRVREYDDRERPTMTDIGVEGSNTSCSVSTDSPGTKSSPNLKLVRKLSSTSPSSVRKVKPHDKWTTPVKRTLNRVESLTKPESSKRLNNPCSSSSESKNSEKDLSTLNIKRKIESESSRKQLKLDSRKMSRKENRGLKPVVKRLDARSYVELFRIQAKVSDPLSGKGKTETLVNEDGNVVGPRSSKEVGEGAVENCISCSKRQRVDLTSKRHRCFCNAKLSHELQSNSLPTGKESLTENKRDREHAACVICMNGGEILYCEGKECRRGYHFSCLDPPLNKVPFGVWHCIWCVKKKIEMGVHSVSKKLESIWKVRDVVSDQEVIQRQKQYLVKYQGLAHVHNQWISEAQMLIEAPDLVVKFNRRNEAKRWKTEWTVPSRLLQKRLLVFPKNDDESCNAGDNNSDCHVEWLVKWNGLKYDHATWELENASFLRSPEAMKLVSDYEYRHKKTERSSHCYKANEEMKASLVELLKFPFGGSPGVHDSCLSYVNKLREYWHKGQNALVVDEQERVVKVTSFILSLQCDVDKPFLIISTAISLWEAEFSQLAPSANIVVYSGNRNVRESIRTLEFYNEKGCLMFEVLLSSPEVVAEDLEFLELLRWEAIIVDECQLSKLLKHFKQINMLAADMRLLVVSSKIKESTDEYLNLLSCLDPGFERISSHRSNICVLKERLAQFVAYECKLGSSRFEEYWVPVQLSNLQLEQYCATLLSNSMLLRSCSKNDLAADLQDIVVSIQKCCDHPYLLDQSLDSIVTKGLPFNEYLDVAIKVSGKLQLLDKMLLEMKSRGLRVLILFKSLGGSGRFAVGDILDDVVCRRFGRDSYIRINGGSYSYSHSKKQAELNMFNDKESGKFVMLIENRACHRSIKVSSVDTVILFDSDWDPLNDLRALQKINIVSHLEKLKVFRLYTSCTVEEKMLLLAKEGVPLDSGTQNQSTCNRLLSWGASYLFNKLDEFHGCSTSIAKLNISSEQTFLNSLLCELSGQLPCNGENSHPINCSIISKVEQDSGVCPKNISLHGEAHSVVNNEPPVFFWKNLLEGRHPRWKFLTESSQRSRRRVNYFDDFVNESEYKPNAVTKKCRKVADNTVDSASLRPMSDDRKQPVSGEKEGLAGSSGCTASTKSELLSCLTNNMHKLDIVNRSSAMPPPTIDISRLPEVDMDKSQERTLNDTQKSILLSSKPEILKLCQILQLPEGVKGTALRFLEYLMKHFDVSPTTTLQAFQIALCWAAASFSKHNIDHKESLALAKLHLDYDCKEKEVRYIFRKLRKRKHDFAPHKKIPKSSNRSRHARVLKSTKSDREVYATGKQALGFIKNNNVSCTIRQQLQICGERMEKPFEKQQREVQEFNNMRDEEKAKLEEERRLEVALTRIRYGGISVRLDKVKLLYHNFKNKMDEHNRQMDICWKNLEASQLASMNEEKLFKAKCMAHLGDTKSGRLIASLGETSKVHINNLSIDQDDHNNATSNSLPFPEDQSYDKVVQSVQPEVPEISADEVTFCGVESSTEAEMTLFERITSSKQLNKSEESSKASVLHSEKHSPDTNVRSMQSGEKPFEVPEIMLKDVVGGDESDDPIITAISTIQPTKECDGTDVATSERATNIESSQEQNSRGVDPTCGEPCILELTETGLSSVQPHTCSVHMEMKCHSVVSGNEVTFCSLPQPASSIESAIETEVTVSERAPLSNVQLNKSDKGHKNCGSDSEKHSPDTNIRNMQSGEKSSEVPENLLNDVLNGDDPTERALLSNMQLNKSDKIHKNCSSDSEKHNSDINVHNMRSGEEPSEVPENLLNDVLNGDDPSKMAMCTMQLSRECDGTDAVTSERAPIIESRQEQDSREVTPTCLMLTKTDSSSVQPHTCSTHMQTTSECDIIDAVASKSATVIEGRQKQDSRSVTPTCGESRTLVLTGTGLSLVQPHTCSAQSSPLPPHQLPLQTSPSSCIHSEAHIPASLCAQQNQSNGINSTQQAQVSRQPVIDAAEIFHTSVMHPRAHVTLQSSTRMPVNGSVQCVSDLRSTTLRESENDNSRPLCSKSDPLQNEMIRILMDRKHAIKIHGETKSQLQFECAKEMEEIRKKYNMLLQDAETELVQKTKYLETCLNKVYMNAFLAKALVLKPNNFNIAGSSATQQATTSQSRPSHWQTARRTYRFDQSSASSLTNASPVPQPVQVVPHSSAVVSTGHSSPMIQFTGELFTGNGLRAPAPHLRFRNPLPVSHLPPLQRGYSSLSSLGPIGNLPNMFPPAQ